MENDEEQRPQEEEEEVNLTLALFDLYWFRSLILLQLPPPPAAEVQIADAESRTSSPTSVSLRRRRLSHRRSLSDDLSPSPTLQIHPPKLQIIPSGKEPSPGDDEIPMFEVTVEEHGQRWKNRRDRRLSHRRSLSDDLSPSPTLQIHPPKLQIIPSGKEPSPGDDEIPMFEVTVEEHGQRWKNRRDRRRRRRRRRRSDRSKSLSELEFKELKGFMDLGFTFSDAETDPRLMEIVPGLQRLKEAAAAARGGDKEPPPPPPQPAAGDEEAVSSSASADDVAVRRPYLSEAWDAEEEEVNRLRNFKIPMAEDGVDLKDQLRFWAHAVASRVR